MRHDTRRNSGRCSGSKGSPAVGSFPEHLSASADTGSVLGPYRRQSGDPICSRHHRPAARCRGCYTGYRKRYRGLVARSAFSFDAEGLAATQTVSGAAIRHGSRCGRLAMKLTAAEIEYLAAWAREEWEPDCYHRPAHRLQIAHGVRGGDLIDFIKAWTQAEGEPDRAILEAASNPNPRWPWQSNEEFEARLSEAKEFWKSAVPGPGN